MDDADSLNYLHIRNDHLTDMTVFYIAPKALHFIRALSNPLARGDPS